MSFRLFLPVSLLLVALPAAGAWQFSGKLPVTGVPDARVFHHLDSAGRKNIAASDGRVAVVWEDNHSGSPQVYLSIKQKIGSVFGQPRLVSSGTEAYEPSIAALDQGRFLVSWEQQGAVFARIATTDTLGEPLQLSTTQASQSSIAGHRSIGYVAWGERRGSHANIRITRLRMEKNGDLKADRSIPIEPAAVAAPQLYPTLAAGEAGVAIAWEDRREGHTRLLFSHSTDGLSFTPPAELNEFFSNRNSYDKGNGVTRVALSTFGEDEVIAAWMDKRRSSRGYSIYAALGGEGGASYGPNERVQGDDGDNLPHYNPTVAGNSDGLFLVCWDDYRRGTSDIWCSGYNDELSWGEDLTPAEASGPGEQSSPSITLDPDGWLHLAWIERTAPGAPTRIWYTFGQYRP